MCEVHSPAWIVTIMRIHMHKPHPIYRFTVQKNPRYCRALKLVQI